MRESLRDVVEMVGCYVLLAASAEEAIAVLAERRPCLIVLDLLMPGMTGLEMLDVMRNEPSWSTVPVIVSTSAPDKAPRGVPRLTKPIDVHAFCAWMQRHCQCS